MTPEQKMIDNYRRAAQMRTEEDPNEPVEIDEETI
jgi:hypothetical protein